MTTSRLEAFTDAVLAIIITIMVLELKAPEGTSVHDLWETTGTGLLAYVLTFVYVGIYWNNHHHMFQLAERVSGGVLWANLHMLFWLSLYPFTTSWMDETGFARVPVIVYGINLLCAGLSWIILERLILHTEGPESRLRNALGTDWKGRISALIYVSGVAIAFVNSALAMVPYAVVALLWLVPDQRVERALDRAGSAANTSQET
jgi:uncharacterized membrane protein